MSSRKIKSAAATTTKLDTATVPVPSISTRPSPGLSSLLYSLRPWSFPINLAAISIGTALAYVNTTNPLKPFSVQNYILALIGGILSQSFGNLINSYYDYDSGLDQNISADDNSIRDGIVTIRQIQLLIGLILSAGLSIVIYFISTIPTTAVINDFYVLIFIGIFIAYSYTGIPFKLKYRGLGDICIFICFGPLLTVGAYYLQFYSINYTVILFSIPIGLTSESILHINNSRDIDIDRKSGALTLPQLIGGLKNSYYLLVLYYSIAYLLCILLAIYYSNLYYLLPFIMIVQLESTILSKFRKQEWMNLCQSAGQFSTGFGILFAISILLAKPQL